jgi:hypothetical protein
MAARVLLLEIAAQGIKGVAPAGGRITLRPGYNVVAADGPPLRRLVEALLYPSPRDAESIPRAAPGPAGPGGAPVRAGITLVGNDQVTYRLVRDFGAGCQLHRFDGEKRSFALVSQDMAEIGVYLAATAGVPPRQRLAALLCLAAADLPSKAGGMGMGGALAAPAARRPATPEQSQKRLAELRAELEQAQSAEKLQYRLDGLQSRLFKAEEALREGAKIDEGLESSRTALRELARVEEVAGKLGDAEARITAFSKAAGKRDEALARVEEEKAAIQDVEGRGPPVPLWQHPPFLAAAGAGLVLFALGLVGAAQGSGLRYVALLDIPAFGGAAWAAWRQIDALEVHSRLGRRRKLAEERERKAQEQFERDTSDVRQALQQLSLQGVPELREQLGKLADAKAALAEWQGRLAAWETQPETLDARAQKTRIEEEMREVEAGLSAEAGGYVRDPRSIEAEMARLEQEAAAPPAEEPAWEPVAAPAVEPLRGLLERAAAELSLTPSALARGLQGKASQVLSALSGQRLSGLTVDDRGNLMAVASGRPQPALSLSPGDRDLCFLSLRVALLEQALAGAKAVALADDAFASLPEGVRRIAGRLLKQAARPGQLVHATRDPLFREAADHAS